MALLTAAHLKELAKFSPEFRWRFRLFLIVAGWLGWVISITDGYRTPAEQNHQHRLNASNPAYDPKRPGSHVMGDAADINAVHQSVVLRKATPVAAWRASGLVALMYTLGLSWGGDFLTYGPNGDAVHIYYKR